MTDDAEALRPPYKLAIFDFDGTLADSAAWFIDTLDHVAERFSFRALPRGELEALRGRSSREVIRALGIPAWKLPLIARHMRKLSLQAAGGIALFPGIDALLHQLSDRGITLAIASSNSEATVRHVFGAPLAATIAQFECGTSMFGKGARIKRIINRAGATASTTIMIGDETRDIDAAHRAGTASGAVHWGYATSGALDNARPTHSFASPEQMARFLTA